MTSRPHTYLAPVRGWVENDSPAMPGERAASVLENWIPSPTGIRVRGGCQAVSTLPVGEAVSGFLVYDDGATQKLFATGPGGIYDASLLDGSPAPVAVASTGGGEWSSLQFTTTGDTFLLAVNGVGDPQLYDGTTWQAVNAASTPIAITGATGPFSSVWVHKSRVYLSKGMTVYYLPVGQMGGAALDLNLGAVFQRGGQIMFGTTWSSDSGAGLGDRMVVVTDAGEIGVFEGSDPADVNNWALVSRYEIARPLGKNAFVRVGGDVMIATTDGIIPVSGIGSKDSVQLSAAAVSAPIARAWSEAVGTATSGWHMIRWDAARVVVVMRPNADREAWAVSTETGAWCKIKGWDMRRASIHQGRLYFGGVDGAVRQGDTTGQDDGEPIVARYRGLLEINPALGLKVVNLARATFSSSDATARMSLRFVTNDRQVFATPPSPWQPVPSGSRWNFASWNNAEWNSVRRELHVITTGWRSIGISGQKVAPEVQVVSDAQLPVAVELVSLDAMLTPGGYVV